MVVTIWQLFKLKFDVLVDESNILIILQDYEIMNKKFQNFYHNH